jgi:hypothetical protein
MSVTFLRSELTRVSIVQLQCSGGTPVDVAGGSNGILVIDDGIIVGPHGAMCVCALGLGETGTTSTDYSHEWEGATSDAGCQYLPIPRRGHCQAGAVLFGAALLLT